jgi:major intracellular serine protease
MSLSEKRMKLIPFTVESIEANAEVLPYGIKQIDAPSVWATGEKGQGIVVAILDTGIDTTHPDLQGRIIDGRNFTDDGSPEDFTDRNGHGTHVAGIIGASEEGSGVIGVAPEVKFLIVKVLGADGSGSYEGIINGIDFATNWVGANGEKVRVMNMSLGGSEDVPEMYQAILRAVAKGIVVCCASGNEGDSDESTSEFGYPGYYNECIEVSASDENFQLAYFSNNNKQVDVIAPGVNVLSTYMNGQYAKLSGTSMATPHVTGAVALLINMGEKQFERTLTESEIYACLVKNTVPLGFRSSSEGHGLVRLSYMNKVRDLLDFVSKNF